MMPEVEIPNAPKPASPAQGGSQTLEKPETKQAVKLTAKAKTFKAKKKTKKYAVTLKTKNGDAIKDAKLTLKLGKKTYSAKTNEKGKATFKIKKLTRKGKYKATVTYAGSSTYESLKKKVRITIK